MASAEAEAINVRADALQGENQGLIAANKLVDLLPGLVEAAAKGLSGSNLTILNGADGVTQLISGLVGQGLSIYETLKPSIAASASVADGEVTSLQSAPSSPAGSNDAAPRRRGPRRPESVTEPPAINEAP